MPSVSLVLPTRHRPDLVGLCIDAFKQADVRDVSLIVSDNAENSQLSCEQVVIRSGDNRIKYVKPAYPMGMVEHWNFAATHSEGNYTGILTDTMLIYPSTIKRAVRAATDSGADIVNWANDTCSPITLSQPFGACYLVRSKRSETPPQSWTYFDPKEALRTKAQAHTKRANQSRHDYASGKICFGLFSSQLIDQIIQKSGALFHPISPDYTSMTLGLSLAKSAVMLADPGILSVMTALSNGNNCAISDAASSKYHQANDSWHIIDHWGACPGLFASESHSLSADYDRMLSLIDSDLSISRINWLIHCMHDLTRNDRVWSSDEAKRQQISILLQAITKHSLISDPKVAELVEDLEAEISGSKVQSSNQSSLTFQRVKGVAVLLKRAVLFSRSRFSSPLKALATRSKEIE